MWLPVLGSAHSDPSFAPELGRHVHYDPRFYDLALVRPLVDGLPPEQALVVMAHRLSGGEAVEERELSCLREMPAFPHGHESAPWVPQLARDHACKRAVGGVCPHAGTDGRSFPRAADGSWTCLHGLRIGADGAVLPYAESSRRSQNAISDCGLTDNTRAASDSIA